MYRNVAFCASDYQLRNILRLMKVKKISKIKVFKLCNDNSDRNQIASANVKLINFKSKYIFYIWSLLILIIAGLLRWQIIFGNINSRFYKCVMLILPPKLITFVDDGMSSGNYDYSSLPAGVTVFSRFKILNGEELDYIKFNNEVKITTDTVATTVLIGQPILTYGFISLENYELIIKKVKHQTQGPIVYYPHRRDVRELEITAKYMTLIERDIDLLDWIYEQSKIPQNFVGFYSTALLEIKDLLPKSQVSAIDIHKYVEPSSQQHITQMMQILNQNEVVINEL